jgi:hypothetical protein
MTNKKLINIIRKNAKHFDITNDLFNLRLFFEDDDLIIEIIASLNYHSDRVFDFYDHDSESREYYIEHVHYVLHYDLKTDIESKFPNIHADDLKGFFEFNIN